MRKQHRDRCVFCQAELPSPARRWDLYSPDGALAGSCGCGAAYVIDETGKLGGQALLDLQAALCDGDLERALKLESGREIEVIQRAVSPRALPAFFPRGGLSLAGPRIWFGRLREP